MLRMSDFVAARKRFYNLSRGLIIFYILHIATDSELFGCRTSVELLVVSEERCLEYSCCCKPVLLFDSSV